MPNSGYSIFNLDEPKKKDHSIAGLWKRQHREDVVIWWIVGVLVAAWLLYSVAIGVTHHQAGESDLQQQINFFHRCEAEAAPIKNAKTLEASLLAMAEMSDACFNLYTNKEGGK